MSCARQVEDARTGAAREIALRRRARPGTAAALLEAVGIVALTTTAAAIARALLHVHDVEMIFLVGVMVAALVAGRGAAFVAAALSVALFDYFFVPPYYTLDVADPRYVVTFATMLGASVVIGTLTLRLREQREAADARARRTAALHGAARAFSAATDLGAVATAACRWGADALGGEAAYLAPGPDGALRAVDGFPAGTRLGADAAELATWVLEHAGSAGLGTGMLGAEPFLCVPVRSYTEVLAVLAFRPGDGRVPTVEQRAALEALAQSAALALARVHHAADAQRAALAADREALRSQLLSSVSHDLRTPLAAITGAATALRDDGRLDAATRRELTDSIVDEAERLERLVANLLDMTRLDQGAVAPRREWVPAEEVIGSALTRMERRLARRAIRTAVEPGLPLLSVDPVLLEQLLVNLLENASRYTPDGSEIAVAARALPDAGAVAIEVADRGPGLAPGEEERIFERFHRGAAAVAGGVGLGLAIARAIARVHGGALSAANRPDGGAVFRLTLPVAPEPPPAGAEPAPSGAAVPGGRA